MKNTNLVIGLSGFATTGKDLFCEVLIKRLKEFNIEAKRLALADALKNDINQFFIDKCGLNIFSCKPEEKELLRPLLVEYGRIKRKQSDGQYWTSILNNAITINKSNNIVSIITDIRYDEYPKDEKYWIKEIHKGVLVYIKKYNLVPNMEATYGGYPVQNGFNKEYTKAPNKDEQKNCLELERSADYIVDWPCTKKFDENKRQEILTNHVNLFLNSVFSLDLLSNVQLS